jgi:DNA-binding HxlR family transcriptional regulator
MAKRSSVEYAACPIARSLLALGDVWTVLILRDAFLGRRRFGDFQKSLGLAKNILSSRLKKLVAHGLLTTVPATDDSAFRDYVLTPKGRGVFPVLVALRQWGEEFGFEGEQVPTRLVDRANRRPVQRLQLLAEDGRKLKLGDTEVIAAS